MEPSFPRTTPTGIRVTAPAADHFRLELSSPRLRILQVTDLHVGLTGKETCRSIRRTCDRFGVDLVVCTGDFFCRNALFIIEHQLHYIEKYVGEHYPWTFAWGNHDLDNRWADDGSFSLDTLDAIEQRLAGLGNCLYLPTREFVEGYPGPGPEDDPREREAFGCVYDPDVPRDQFDGYYGGNFALEVVAPGEVEPALDLYVLNSRGSYHIPPKVMAWMRDRVARRGMDPGDRVPALCFYHVPNYEYHLVWESGQAHGFKKEPVCHGRDDGRVHRFFKSLGPGVVRACFVGHDHVNDYWGEWEGIRYVYGRKTGLGGYGSSATEPGPGEKAVRVGATLIEVETRGTDFEFTHRTVFEDGSTWSPKIS
ncbi:MAG: metallophosphoesterase [Promethearchaeota archaeon]